MAAHGIRVFVSSTSEDLADHRAVARNVILDMHWQPVMMEHMGASPKSTVSACLDLVEQCDLLILIVAFRQGWVPGPEQGGGGEASITAFELDHARSKNVPVLAFLADDDWPGKLWEQEQKARDWVHQFRADLNLPAVFFGHEDDPSLPIFRAKLREQLVNYREELVAREARAVRAGGSLAYLSDARDNMVKGDNIPFIGPDIYGDGPLSPGAVARALAPELEQDTGKLVLATAAEYREQRDGSRAIFLEHLAQLIKAQSAQARSCRIYDLIGAMNPPWFVVCTCLDRKLEERLDEAGLEYVVVTHILRSYDNKHDGKILALRKGKPPEIFVTGKLELGDDENVIYRPLGSPLLHEGLDEDLELDTAVITESDHLTFLRRLEHENTEIPSRFARVLRTRPLIFLGYALDLWHFRLIMQVFQSVGGRPRRASTIAVRKSASHMEDMAWQRLGANLIPLELEEFVDRVDDGTDPASA